MKRSHEMTDAEAIDAGLIHVERVIRSADVDALLDATKPTPLHLVPPVDLDAHDDPEGVANAILDTVERLDRKCDQLEARLDEERSAREFFAGCLTAVIDRLNVRLTLLDGGGPK